MNKFKIIVTGGHLGPALSVIEALPKDWDVLIVGRKSTFEGDEHFSLEYQAARELGIPFQSITAGRFERTFTKYTIPSLLKVPLGFFQAMGIVKKFRPDIILSFGGYVSFPVVLAGAILGVPIVIHEQTLKGGLANKIEAFFAKKVCISWETSRNYFPKEKTVLTGNPIREFRSKNLELRIPEGEGPLVYITGGSTGSHTINNVVKECLEELLKKYRIIHQAGDSQEYRDFDTLRDLREKLEPKLQKRYVLTKFVKPEDVGGILSLCDLVITRAGINTITELMFFGKSAILIPLNNEQMDNALFFQSLGFGEILPQDNLSSMRLRNLVESMIGSGNGYREQKEAVGKLLKKDAAKIIVEIIQNELEKSKTERKTRR